VIDDSPASVVALSAMRELLVALRQRGLFSAVEILDLLDKIDPGIAAEGDFSQQVYQACLWLKAPHMADGLVQALERAARKSDN
jgi:hypothetical protein